MPRNCAQCAAPRAHRRERARRADRPARRRSGDRRAEGSRAAAQIRRLRAVGEEPSAGAVGSGGGQGLPTDGAEESDEESPAFEAELWDGGAPSGRLTDLAAPVRGGNVAWQIPVATSLKSTSPRPLSPSPRGSASCVDPRPGESGDETRQGGICCAGRTGAAGQTTAQRDRRANVRRGDSPHAPSARRRR